MALFGKYQLHFKNLLWLGLAFAVVALDYVSKMMALDGLSYGKPLPITENLDLTLVYNKGASFSFLSNSEDSLNFFITTGIGYLCVLLYFLLRLPSNDRMLCAGTALCLGGSLANLYDRMNYGYVIDFVYLHFNANAFPIFNLADVFISLGVALVGSWLVIGYLPSVRVPK